MQHALIAGKQYRNKVQREMAELKTAQFRMSPHYVERKRRSKGVLVRISATSPRQLLEAGRDSAVPASFQSYGCRFVDVAGGTPGGVTVG